MLNNSPIEPFYFRGVKFWLKRDDLLDIDIDGNKARKFYSLCKSSLAEFDTIISYGGTQSNAMYSLSALAKRKNKKFVYYTKKLSQTALNSNGNLKYALDNGMVLVELANDEYQKVSIQGCGLVGGELFIPQGGAFDASREGLWLLADELNEFCSLMRFEHPKVIVSAGTGTSAAFLSERFCGKVFCVPCVGGKEYLNEQMSMLIESRFLPKIVDTAQKFTFAKPNIALYDMYDELLNIGVEFDLIYDSKTWLAVSQHLELFNDEQTIFVHSGGIRGNESQLERYKYLGLIDT